MEHYEAHGVSLEGRPLALDYAPSSATVHQVPGSAAPLADWLCNMCGAVNFARRLECYQCTCERPPNAQRVTAEAEIRSRILKVTGDGDREGKAVPMCCMARAFAKNQPLFGAALWISLGFSWLGGPLPDFIHG